MPKGGNGGGGGGKPGGGGGGVNQINGHDKKDDTLIGTDGNDAILGKGGNDVLEGRLGDDFLSGGDGDDWLYGNDDSDYTLAAEETDNDRLFGGNGDDHLFGGDGDDELQGGAGIDELDGGDGDDVAYYMETTEGITVTASAADNGYIINFNISGEQEIAKNIEAIAATNRDDTMTGFDDRADWFDGVGGNDTIYGLGGDDSINGGGGNDTIDGGTGNDTIYGGSGDDTITGGGGDDVIDAGSNAWWEQPDQDDIDGGAGNDTISGGGGTDILAGGLDADTFIYNFASDGGDSIPDFSGFEAGAGEGDMIDLQALGLGGLTVEYIDVLNGNQLWVDVDGGGTVDGTGDDVLIATFTDGGGGFTLDNNDVLI